MIINYAHRGASAYAPENTFAAFYKALEMGANGIETDIRQTRDGVIVLFHDETLERVTGARGRLSDYNYKDIHELDAGGFFGEQYRHEKIVRLEDFLRYFGTKNLLFAIEFKVAGIEKQAVDVICRFGTQHKTTVTSFNHRTLGRVKDINAHIDVGFLTPEINDESIAKCRDIRAAQICPKAVYLTPEGVQKAREEGLAVRAYGIEDEQHMLRALECGVDGMTIDFPDMLAERCGQKNL